MIALILKDITVLKKSLFISIAIWMGLCIYGIYDGTIMMIPLSCVMLPIILTALSFGSDVKSNFEQMAFSMPVKRSRYVISKLFFAFVIGLTGAITIFILMLLENKNSIEIVIISSIMTLIISLFIPSIQLLFMIKYGEEKVRLIMVMTYLIIMAAASIIKDRINLFGEGMRLLNEIPLYILGTGLIMAGIILTGVMIKISIVVMNKKEY